VSLLIDLDRLDRQSSLFAVNSASLHSFYEADHGERDGSSLRAYAGRRAAVHDIEPPGERLNRHILECDREAPCSLPPSLAADVP
jgi:DUF1365 family protein